MNVISEIGGSKIVFILCLIPIVVTWIQSWLFLRKGLKEANRIGIEKNKVNKVISNSLIFSILPTVPIILTLGPLMNVLGKYIPWLRLSVIGNAAYEGIAADMALKAYGLEGLGEAKITEPAFIAIIFAMTIGIMVGPILTVAVLKKFDKKIKGIKAKEGGFAAIGFSALFIGLVSVLGVPIATNTKNIVGIFTILVSGVVVLLLEKISKITKKSIIKDFSFPLAMIIGMISAIFWAKIF